MARSCRAHSGDGGQVSDIMNEYADVCAERDRLKTELETNRTATAGGETMMSEPVWWCDCGDRCHEECIALKSERDALKAELETERRNLNRYRDLAEEQKAEISKLKAFDWQNAMIDFTSDRDLWKSRAAKYREALERLAKGVDHLGGYREVPEFYEAINWASEIAQEALKEAE